MCITKLGLSRKKARFFGSPKNLKEKTDLFLIERSKYILLSLIATSTTAASLLCASRAATLGESISISMGLFDQLRDNQPKVDATLYSQLLADLSISMATMASNHLWMNIESRIERFLVWKYPELKKFHKTIVRAVVTLPKESIDKIFDVDSAYKAEHAKARRLLAAKTVPKLVSKRKVKMTPEKEAKLKEAAVKVAKEAVQRQAASDVAGEMRQLMPLPGRKKFASKCHLTLRMYYWLLKQIEAGKADHDVKNAEAVLAGQAKSKPFKGRLFSILPLKNGFTTSYIPISSSFLLVLLRSLKLSDHEGDGRGLDFHKVWSKFFAVSLVETKKSRSFGCRILTDGYAVSALVSCKVSLDTSKGKSDVGIDSMQAVLAASAAKGTTVRMAGVDPGFTDIVTASFNDGSKTVSYSSSKYYERAKVKHSTRRTCAMNLEEKVTTDTLFGGKTADPEQMREYIKAYLTHLKRLLVHRMTTKYRKLRFLRHIYKQVTVREIVDLIVGPETSEKVTLVGFGNWSGGSRSPISRQHAGPIQLIKDKIGKRMNAEIKPVDEYKTSQLDSNTYCPLVNMIATSKVRKKDGSMVVRLNNKVHKVLHCKPSDNCKLTCKETTWNRDVNASRNILNLFLNELTGKERPSAFCRPVKKDRSVGMSVAVDPEVMNPEHVITFAPTGPL